MYTFQSTFYAQELWLNSQQELFNMAFLILSVSFCIYLEQYYTYTWSFYFSVTETTVITNLKRCLTPWFKTCGFKQHWNWHGNGTIQDIRVFCFITHFIMRPNCLTCPCNNNEWHPKLPLFPKGTQGPPAKKASFDAPRSKAKDCPYCGGKLTA